MQSSRTPQTQIDAATVRRSRMFLIAALLGVLVIAAGFGTGFKTRVLEGEVSLPLILHGHAAVMLLWEGFFVLQLLLVFKGNSALHRRLGHWGFVLALAVIASCLSTAVWSTQQHMASGPAALSFLAFPIADTLVFTLLVVAGLGLRRRRDWHSRLMLLANLSLLLPAIARLPFSFIENGGSWVGFAVHDSLIVAVLAWDFARQRRLHPAYLAGFALLLLSQPLRVWVGASPAWIEFAGRMLA